MKTIYNKKAVLSQENRAMPQLLFFGLNFANKIHYKFKSSQLSKVRLQSSKNTDTKQNLTQNGHSSSLLRSNALNVNECKMK